MVSDRAARYWRFAWGLRDFLKDPVTVERSRHIIQQRMADREKNLLALAKGAIYGNENSPYLKLLNLAGCEYGDLEKLVYSDGVEAALKKLREEGEAVTQEQAGHKLHRLYGKDVRQEMSRARVRTHA